MTKQVSWSSRAALAGAVLGAVVCAMQAGAVSAPKETAPAADAKIDGVLLQTMDAEMARAMADLGSGAPGVDPKTKQPAQPQPKPCLLYTSPSPRDRQKSRMP